MAQAFLIQPEGMIPIKLKNESTNQEWIMFKDKPCNNIELLADKVVLTTPSDGQVELVGLEVRSFDMLRALFVIAINVHNDSIKTAPPFIFGAGANSSADQQWQDCYEKYWNDAQGVVTIFRIPTPLPTISLRRVYFT